jgi:hypothetical protein
MVHREGVSVARDSTDEEWLSDLVSLIELKEYGIYDAYGLPTPYEGELKMYRAQLKLVIHQSRAIGTQLS